MRRAPGPGRRPRRTSDLRSRRTESTGSRGSRRHRERGAAAVLVLACAGVLVLLSLTAGAVAAVAVARQRAASVADLAALAAAGRALDGERAACARAGVVAALSGATVTSCRVDGDVAELVVQVRPPGRLGELGAATGRARAGPAAAHP